MTRGFRILLFALAPLVLCSSCSQFFVPAFLPVDADMPIDLSKAGNTAEKEFRIWVQDDYRVQWQFRTSGGVEDNEVHKYLLGESIQRLGVSIPVHLTLVRVESGGDSVFYDKDVTVQCNSLAPGGGFIFGNLIRLPLSPGKYRLKITSLQDHYRLQYVPTTVYITYVRF